MKRPFTIGLALLITTGIFAQEEYQPLHVKAGRAQAFFVDALVFPAPDEYGVSSRVDVYVQVPFDIITFVKKEELYVAGYSVTIVVSNEEGTRMKEETWTRSIERIAFESTVSPSHYDLSYRSLNMESGAYLYEVIVEDKESAREYRSSRKLAVQKFDRNVFSISDIMLVNQVQNKDGRKHLSPQIDPNVAALSEGFHLFFELYNPYDLQAASLNISVAKRGQLVMNKWEQLPLRKGLNPFLTDLRLPDGNIGSYQIEITAFRGDDTTNIGILSKASKTCIIEWLSGGTPISITDLDEAIEQLRYFAKSDELRYIKNAEDETEKRKRFEEFWERHNPAPGAKPNRALVEYYGRVAYANEKFRHYIDGWKTDRGMVYIVYGPPSYVDRNPMDYETKPYEVWEYYDINKRFVFIDDSGFGDYRLLYPIWDERNRLR